MHYLSPTGSRSTTTCRSPRSCSTSSTSSSRSSKGYASLDYEPIGNRPSDLVKLDVLLAGDKVDALSLIVHKEASYDQGREPGRAPPQDDPAAAVRRPGPGRDRRQRDRPRDRQGAAQGRHREALRRRRHPQAQAAREAEEGQEADEAGRRGRGPAGGLPRRARGRWRLASSENVELARGRARGLDRGRAVDARC